MGQPIRDIVIVGGGTTGWLVAAHLNHRLQWGLAHPEGVRITLIESPDVPIIGVGEATIPPVRHTLQMLEIDENEFVARTHATFKLGVRFDDWGVDAAGRRTSFFHPFTGGVQVGGRNPAMSLLAYGVPEDLAIDPQLGNVIGHGVAAAEAYRAPRRHDDAPFGGGLGYAYHLDAGLFSEFLQEVATARGVIHVRDKVVGVERDQRGHIGALLLESGGKHPVELVVDCSGFRGLLINQELEEPFIPFADYLPNDSAIAIQVAHGKEPDLYPATISAAMDSGWSWRIPLQSRAGTGHVFCTSFISRDAAVDALLARNAGQQLITEPREVPMRVGRCRRSWVGNCVAIGLAGGFLEPLESTSIQFADYACRRLLQFLPTSDFEPEPIDKFNAEMAAAYDEVRDFLGLHFTLGNREDTPYWRAMRHEVKRSDALEHCLALWRRALPDVYDPRLSTIFTFWSITAVLFGKGFYQAPLASGTDLLPRPVWERYLREMTGLRAAVVGSLPGHAEMLRAMVEAAVPGATASKAAASRAIPILGNALGPSIPVMTPGRI
jgi:tryptophan 6-halogenase